VGSGKWEASDYRAKLPSSNFPPPTLHPLNRKSRLDVAGKMLNIKIFNISYFRRKFSLEWHDNGIYLVPKNGFFTVPDRFADGIPLSQACGRGKPSTVSAAAVNR